jgi:mucin-19
MAMLPPPPLRAETGSFQWLDWYNKLQSAVTVPGSISWATIDKTGSSLADLATRQHAQLTAIQGGTAGERYHLTAAEHSNISSLPSAANIVVTTGSYSDPSWLSLSKSKVGLSNVDNTADASKSVLYAASAGSVPYSGLTGTVPTWNQNTTGTASNVTGVVAVANGGTGATTAPTALTNLGAYPASNPSGYTSNTGTVTSVSGTGTVSGLSLSGTVTTTGNITLGGSLDLSSPPAIGATAPNTGKFTNLEATGTVKLGTYTASVGLTTTGYITITDSGGTTRRLAVV